ncbi:MAG: SdrD B-like domain-containing protein [Pseudomonadota bacterium]
MPRVVTRIVTALLASWAFVSLPASAQQDAVKSLVFPSDGTAQNGETIRYRIQVQCSDFDLDCGLTDVVDNLPPEVLFSSCQGSGGFTCDPSAAPTVTWSNPNFGAGETVDLIIEVTVAQGVPPVTPIVNSGTITQRTDPGNPVPFVTPPGDTVTTEPGMPQYVARKTRVSPPPAFDFPVVYNVQFCSATGVGNVSLNNIEMVDTFPAGATVLTASGGTVMGNTITWDAANLSEFNDGTFDFSIPDAYATGSQGSERCITRSVTLVYPSGTFNADMDDMEAVSNAVAISGDPASGPPGPIGDSDTADDTIMIGNAAVSVSKSAPDVELATGGPMSWTLSANNSGSNVPILGLELHEAIPPISDTVNNPMMNTAPQTITSGSWNSPDYFDVAGMMQTSDVRAVIEVAVDDGVNDPGSPADCANETYTQTLGSNVTGIAGSTFDLSSITPAPTCVRWTFTDITATSNPPGAIPLGWSFSSTFVLDTNSVVEADDPDDGMAPIRIQNCLYARFDADTDPATMGLSDQLGCGTANIELGTAAVSATKSRAVFTPEGNSRSGDPFPGDEIVYTLQLSHDNDSSTGDFVNPIIADLLPLNVEFLSWESYSDNLSTSVFPFFERIDSFDAGRTLLRFSWSDPGEAPAGAVDFFGAPINPVTDSNPATFSESEDPVRIEVRVRVTDGTAPGTLLENQIVVFDRGPRVSCSSGTPMAEAAGIDLSGNDADGDGTADNDVFCPSLTNTAAVASAAVLGGAKFVQGNGEADRLNVDNPFASPEIVDLACPGGLMDFTRTPCVAQTDHELEPNSDATFTYRVRVVNSGNVGLTNYVLYDVLPDLNDTGVGPALFGLPRGSTFRPVLDGSITLNAGLSDVTPTGTVIEYTTEPLPCRSELEGLPPFEDWPPGCVDSYSTTLPADLTTVTGFRITIPFGDGGVGSPWGPAETVVFEVPMRAPEGSPISTPSLFEDGNSANDLFNPAWNTFAHRAQRTDDSSFLLAAEPPRVGVILPEAYRLGNLVWLDVDHDGVAEDGEPGIEGVRVSVLSDETGDGASADDRLFGTTTTDADGKYAFSGLPAGTYYVVVEDGQNGMGGPLADLFTSTFGQDTPDSDVDNRDDGTLVVTGLGGTDKDGNATGSTFDGLASAPVVLGPADNEPTNERLRSDDATDDDDDAFADNFSNFSIDFGYYRPFALGNRVFLDEGAGTDFNDGELDAGEVGIDGVTVRLLDASGAPYDSDPDTGGIQQPTTTTASGGYYLFDDLPPGDYRVEVELPPSLVNLASSTGALATMPFEPAGDPDDDTDSDDNGTTVTPGSRFRSGVATLGSATMPAEPTTDADRAPITNPQGTASDGSELPDNQSNLSVDFGFFTSVSIGSTVFEDPNNNGVQDGGELGIDDADVGLYAPGPDGLVGTADDIFVASTTTSGGGDYFFRDLQPGDYYVQVETTSFGAGRGLETFPTSSRPTATLDDNVDGNDDGAQSGGGTVVRSPIINLAINGEVAGDAMTGVENFQGGAQDDAIDEDNGNMTVDFGFIPAAQLVSIGSTVFEDPNDNGFQDGTENGIDGVSVELLQDTDGNGVIEGAETTAFLTTTTAGGGNYFFGDLPPGNYQVRIPTPPAGFLLSSTPTDTADNEEDGDDNGSQPGGAGTVVTSPLIELLPDDEPTGDGTAGDDEDAQAGDTDDGIDDNNGDMTIDFGFVNVAVAAEVVSVGSTVFLDAENNGLQDGTDAGIPGVLVELKRAGPDGMIGTADDIDLTSQLTDMAGNYFFDQLPPATDYYIEIPTPPVAAPLSSTPTSFTDDRVDNDDDGDQPAGPGTVVRSPLFALAPDDEPTGDAMTGDEFAQGGDADDGPDDNHGDMTLDFGFFAAGVADVVSVGSTIFEDPNNNGVQDAGDTGIPGVDVQLWDTGADGLAGTADDFLVSTDTTDGMGDYFFPFLPAGDYFIRIPTPPATAPLSSTPTSAMDDNTDGNDDGAQPGGIGTLVESPVFNLAVGDEPQDDRETFQGNLQDAADDDNGNMTLDFGFVPVLDIVAVGSTVFEDGNNNGVQDTGELGLPDVDLQLFDPGNDGVIGGGDDFLIATTTTDANGDYLFDQLPARDYYVQVAASSFDPGRGLELRLLSSTPTATTDDNVDGNDDGTQPGGFGTVAQSPVFDLAIDDEVGDAFETFQGNMQDNDGIGADEDNGNMTVDFGFVPVTDVVALGSTVFLDPNNNGQQDGGEAGIPGIVVELYLPGDDGAIGGGDDRLLTTTTTDAQGDYLFDNLPAGAYYVRIPTPPAAAPLSSTRTSRLDDSTDIDDNGEQLGGIGTEVLSPVVTLQINGEPDDGDEAGQGGIQDAGLTGADDDNGEMTVDFGFVPVLDVVAIGSTVFEDPDDSGTQGPGEDGLAGTTVQLFSADLNLLLAQTVTNNDGNYLFDSLPEGDYFVVIPAPPLGAPRSSTFDGTADNGQDADDNGTQDVFNGPARSPVIQLRIDGEPDGGDEFAQGGTFDNGPAVADDDNGDMTIDFGFIPEADLVAIGSTVFRDINNNGLQDPGETGIAGVTLDLYRVGPDGLPGTADDEFFGTTDSDANGDYLFTNLPIGEYFVEILTPPADAPLSSTNTDPEDNAEDGDDNGDQPGGAGAVTRSPVIALEAGTESTDETGQGGNQDDSDDAAGDMTVDFGFVDPASLVAVGSTVFEDPNNDGRQNVGEAGIDGVTVELWLPGGDGMVGGTDDVRVADTVTDPNGDYLFENLPPGRYYLRLPTPPDGLALSSTPTAVDDDGVDGDDNGIQPGGLGTETVSPVFSLDIDSEPVGAAESFQGGLQDPDDDNGDMTLDFGFLAVDGVVSIGSTVFEDPNNNGIQDDLEAGFAGVEVVLYAPGPDGEIGGADDVRLAATTTDASGDYFFGDLPPGLYYVEVPMPPDGAPISSTPTSTADDGIDGDDNGAQPDGAGTAARSPLIALTRGGELTAEGAQGGAQDDADDSSGDMTIDFGFVPAEGPVSIGSTVFEDPDNDGRQGLDEAGIPGVVVLLYGAGPDGLVGGGDDILVAETATDAAGDYFFDNLPPGDYYIELPTPPAGSPLSSTPTSTADDGVDGDDNGAQPDGAGGLVRSPVVRLAVGAEPTDEAVQGGGQDDGDDTSGDMTLDFGFVPLDGDPVSIGSTVFADLDNDGRQGESENGIAGVTVNLVDPGPDGLGGTPDDVLLATTTTDADGNYFFGDLPPGDYVVEIPQPPVLLPLSSTPTTTVDDGMDGDDNGSQPAGPGTVTRSPVISLTPGGEPVGEVGQGGDQDSADGDANGDMTVDFGFVPLGDGVVSLGSTVFFDGDNNGIQDAGESGIAGVPVQLVDPGPDGIVGTADDTLLAETVTDADGNYLFDNLLPGSYGVVVPVPPAGAPQSSTPTALDDDGMDGDDNGAQPDGAGTPAFSPVVTLLPGTEPTDEAGQGGDQDGGDDGSGDMTIDFGFTDVEPVFDLALLKTLADGQPSQVFIGDVVRFAITVFNQGDTPVQQVMVVDYLPTGFTLVDDAWTTEDGLAATRFIDGPLAAGDSLTVDIALLVGPDAATDSVNVAEIGTFEDPNGTTPPDVDSVPDVDPGNDPGGEAGTPADDETGGDGTGSSGGDPDGDEDDSDPAGVEVIGNPGPTGTFDLALTKGLAENQSDQVLRGFPVNFRVTVTNEGTIPAVDVIVVDYLPAGLTLIENGVWTLVDGQPTTTISRLEPGQSVELALRAAVNRDVRTGTVLVNGAEVVEANDPSGNAPPDVDSMPDNDPGNDPPTEDDSGSSPPIEVVDPAPIPVLSPFGLAALIVLLLLFGGRRATARI